MKKAGNSLAVQWLELGASTAGNPVLIPGWGTEISKARQCDQIIEKESI